MKQLHLLLLALIPLVSIGCSSAFNPNGPPPRKEAYFQSTEPTVVKGISVPIGAKIVYGNSHRKGSLGRPMSEDKITALEFPAGKPLRWGGVPVTSIRKFYNTDMRGFTVEADFDRPASGNMNRFAQLWRSSGSDDLGVDIINPADWSFNPRNISDVESCGSYQRYFKDDAKQQRFLDALYAALKNS